MLEKEREFSKFNDELADYRQIREVVADYPVRPYSFRRDMDAWVVETDKGTVRVVKFRHSLPEFFFVLSAVSFLQHKSFGSFPKIFVNLKEQPITQHPQGLFCVMENPSGRTANAGEIDVLTGITRHLAKLHRASVGFSPPPVVQGVRQDWGDWEEKWQYRLDELYRLGEEAQHHKGEFEHLYLKALDDFIQDGVDALEKLKTLDIRNLIEGERLRGGLCQRDYKPANLIEQNDGYCLLDFDDFAGQSHLEDVARFIKEVGDWDPEKIRYIFDVYSEVYAVSEQEREAILAYLKLPLDFWKVARNYYLRGKPQKRNLKRVIQDMIRRKRCFAQLNNPKSFSFLISRTPWTWGLPAENPPEVSVEQFWSRWDWGRNWQVPAGNPIEEAPLKQCEVSGAEVQPASDETLPEPPAENEDAFSGQTSLGSREDSATVVGMKDGEAEVVGFNAAETGDSGDGEDEKPTEDEALDFEPPEETAPAPPTEREGSSIPETPAPAEAVAAPKPLVWKAFPKPLASR